MKWNEAIAAVRTVKTAGRGDTDVCGVQYDSRRVGIGDVFVAMRGGTSDGNRFTDAVLKAGAAAIVTDSVDTFVTLRTARPDLSLALVEHGRRALAEVSSAIFDAPEKVLKISAVTGTNGKTTTAFLLEQLLRSVERKCVLLGTIETRIGDDVRESEHTTPESRDVLATFAEGVAVGCTEAVMEMSSHALEQERVWGMPVDVAIFTNLTQDHLDYHGTMDEYAAAKAKMFGGVGARAPRVAVINADDDHSGLMLVSAKNCETVWTYGAIALMSPAPDFVAKDIALSASDTSFTFVTPFGEREIETRLAGMVNVYNVVAAMTAAIGRGLTLDEVATSATDLKPAPGRFETVANNLGITVVVDYAHTDDALRNLLGLARELVGTGRVITAFGCGGDRDRTKRAKMGRVAASMSDLVVVTSDNPRSENPLAIIEDVLGGVREVLGVGSGQVVVEADRHVAIQVAIQAARAGDIVLLAGKGHEKVQIFADGAVAFDDVAEAARVLQEMGG